MKRKTHYPKKGLRISRWIPLLGILVLFMMVVPGLTIASDELNGASPGIKGQAPKEYEYDYGAPYVADEVLVKFKESMDRAQADSLAMEHNCRVEESIATIRLHRMKILDRRDVWDVAAEFEAKPNVEYAEPNFIDKPVGYPTYDQSLPGDVPAIAPLDPMYGDQWHYPLINMPDAWNVNAGGLGVIAAVVDTGVRFDHPDLTARLSGNGYDFIDLDSDPTDPGSGSPAYSHGTHVTGTVGAATNNAIGVTGMSWKGSILPVRALGTHFEMAQGFRYAAGLLVPPDPVNPTPVRVLNYSGGGSHSTTKQLGVADCNAAGVIMVCAAGNDYGGPVIYPAAYSTTYDKVIAVGATDYNYGGSPQRAPYSNVGISINVAAPGGNTLVDTDSDGNPDGILSTAWNYGTSSPTYEFWQGTSMASPHVTGLVALMLEQGVNPDSVRSILQSTAVDLGTPGFDNEFGWGLVDAKAALDAVPKIAIIATRTTTNSVDKALTDLGRIYAKFSTSDFESVDLSTYGTVIVAMDGGSPSSADIQHLANFANSGGNLIMMGGSYSADFASAVDTYLLDIDEATYTWKTVTVSPNLEVTAPMHQLAQGLPATYDFINNNASYYMIRSQDGAAEEAAVNGDGETALLKKKMSNGTLTWFINSPYDAYWGNAADYAVLKQIIENALGVSFASPDGATRGLAWDGNHLWSADSGDGNSIAGKAYYKIDPASGTVVDGFVRTTGAIGPLGLTFDGTNIWSAEWSTIYKHNPADMSVISSFVSPRSSPADLAWDGTYLWAAILQSGPIIKIDPVTGAEVNSIPVPAGSRPFGLTYAMGYLYLGDDGTNTIYKLDPATGAVMASWPSPGTYPAGLAFDGAYLWVADWDTDRIYRMMKIMPKGCVIENFSDPLGGWQTRWFYSNTNAENWYTADGGNCDPNYRGNQPDGIWISDDRGCGNLVNQSPVRIDFLNSYGDTATAFSMDHFTCVSGVTLNIYDRDGVLAVSEPVPANCWNWSHFSTPLTNGISAFEYAYTGNNVEGNTSIDNVELCFGAGVFGDELAVDFGGNGLWHYDGSTFTQLNGQNPEAMEDWNGGLAGDFDGNGLWNYNGSSWNLLTTLNPQSMEAWDSSLAVDFGTFGLWSYNGSSWSLLTTSNAETMQAWSGGLAADFGSSGLWTYNGSSWSLLTTSNASGMESWANGLAVDFGSFGLWNYNGSSWSLLTTSNPEDMRAWSGGLATDFGTFGLWNYNGSSWSLLTTSNASGMADWNGGVAVDFSSGLWSYDGSSWDLLTTTHPEDMEGWATSLAADLGTSGLWNYNGSVWSQLTAWNAEDMIDVDLY
jgi:subtilisin family serine protease